MRAQKRVWQGGEALVLAAAEGDSEQNADCDDLMDARGVCALWPKAHDTVSLVCVWLVCLSRDCTERREDVRTELRFRMARLGH